MRSKRPFSLVELIVAFTLVAMMAALVLRPTYRAMERMRFDYSCRLVKDRAKTLALRAQTSEKVLQAEITLSEGRLTFGGVSIDGVERVTLDGRPVAKEVLDVFPRTGFCKRELAIEGPKRILLNL